MATLSVEGEMATLDEMVSLSAKEMQVTFFKQCALNFHFRTALDPCLVVVFAPSEHIHACLQQNSSPIPPGKFIILCVA